MGGATVVVVIGRGGRGRGRRAAVRDAALRSRSRLPRGGGRQRRGRGRGRRRRGSAIDPEAVSSVRRGSAQGGGKSRILRRGGDDDISEHRRVHSVERCRGDAPRAVHVGDARQGPCHVVVVALPPAHHGDPACQVRATVHVWLDPLQSNRECVVVVGGAQKQHVPSSGG